MAHGVQIKQTVSRTCIAGCDTQSQAAQELFPARRLPK